MDSEPVYFSDREQGMTPATGDDVNDAFWRGFVTYFDTLRDKHFLVEDFPLLCPDPNAQLPYCADLDKVGEALKAEVHDARWPLDPAVTPNTDVAMDIVEFFHRRVSKPQKTRYHDSYEHQHFRTFERRKIRVAYRAQVNLLFRRSGLAFELDGEGKVRRLGPPVLRGVLANAVFKTGDSELDSLLEVARTKFGDPDATVRKDALDKLWDAWERLKTVGPESNKAQQAAALLTSAVPEPNFHKKIDVEAHALTDIGNEFTIRHHETNKHPVQEAEYVDYLFHRMFALIWLLLKRTNRLK